MVTSPLRVFLANLFDGLAFCQMIQPHDSLDSFVAVSENEYGYHAVILFQDRFAATAHDHKGLPGIRLFPQIVKLQIQKIFLR